MSFLHKKKGARKKSAPSGATFDFKDRPSVPPPPPPSTTNPSKTPHTPSTTQPFATDSQDCSPNVASAASIAVSTSPATDPKKKDSASKSRFYSEGDRDFTEKNSKRKKSPRSSSGSSKFYTSLEDNPEKSDDTVLSPNVLNTPSINSDGSCPNTESKQEKQCVENVLEAGDRGEVGEGSSRDRQLLQHIPGGRRPGPPPRPTPGFATKSETPLEGSRSVTTKPLLVTQHTSQETSPQKVDDENSDKHEEKKNQSIASTSTRRRNIKTMDCPLPKGYNVLNSPNLSGIDSEAGSSNDELELHQSKPGVISRMESQKNSETVDLSQIRAKLKPVNQSHSDKQQQVLPLTPIVVKNTSVIGPKPSILRPKPKLLNLRTNSFTAEDMDICHKKQNIEVSVIMENSSTSRPSRCDMLSPTSERAANRRSRSLGAPQISRNLSYVKPSVPKKPKNLSQIVPDSHPGIAEKAKSPPLKPKPLKPKPSLSKLLEDPEQISSTSHENLTETMRNGKDVSEDLKRYKSLDACVNSDSNETSTDIVNNSSELKSDNCLDVMTNLQQILSGSKPGMMRLGKCVEVQENVPDKTIGCKNICDIPKIQTDDNNTYEHVSDSELKPFSAVKIQDNVAAPSSGKVSRKASRSASARRILKSKKSFRNKAYKDLDLKEEIPDGISEEELQFSVSEDEDLSDDSFTDEDDIEYEQEQARILGFSPDKLVMESSLNESAHPKDKLFRIAEELLTTERSYMSKLKIIDQDFHNRVIMENRQNHFLPENVIPQIFANVKSIYGFHDFLLKQLEERISKWENIKKVGDIMMKWAPFLKLYTEYINNFDHAMNTFNTCMEKYPKFASIVEEIQATKECGMLTLQHHMLGPIQRVPRYEMLLKDYLKHLPEDSDDRSDTEKALELVTTAATHANEQIKKNELSQKLLNISESILGSSNLNLITPTRKLLKEGSITKISARDGSHLDRYLFLFNDCLLVCTPLTLSKIVNHKYKFKSKLDVEGMRVMEGDDLYTPNTFLVKSKAKSIEFHTSTVEEKDEWQAMLWSVISDYHKNRMTRMAGVTLTESIEKDELGKRAPTWIKDQAASMCMVCASVFTTFFRRHHCRACGRVVCGMCSSRKVRLFYDGDKYNRVCNICYDTLELKIDPSKINSPHRQDQTLKAVKATDPALRAGYLNMSQDTKHWEKRYFAARDNFLLYSYKAHQDLCALTSLPLPGYVVDLVTNNTQLKDKCIFKLFHIGLKKEYYFQADDKNSLDRWMSILEMLVRAELPDSDMIRPPSKLPRQSSAANDEAFVPQSPIECMYTTIPEALHDDNSIKDL